ncbi:sensor histidine kinase [Puerhibacterium sp. TATVAM-FAB25]|uniref:sensor histidine kinase n=1 Tax=Puerhibacterium sp. TATVAM-FAB25 TaxID=3093699 RepID=UPI00397B33D8
MLRPTSHPAAVRRPTLAERVGDWFGVDEDWERVPADPRAAARHDVLVGLALVALTSLTLELARSAGAFEGVDEPAWLLHLLAASGAVPLIWRRRYPLAVMVLCYAHFLGVGLAVPVVTTTVSLQVVYFVALCTAVAWARDRRAMVLTVGLTVLVMFLWIVWDVAVGTGLQGIIDQLELDDGHPGLIDPAVAMVGYTWMINLAFFFGAIAAGQLMWRAARRQAQLTEQAATIERQAAELQEQAVVEERLRIARELHDVVAHHVSVIGIHATAARRLVAKDPDAAAAPLATIETASREAVTQMRGLLGTLRSGTGPGAPAAAASVGAGGADDAGTTGTDRSPEPGLGDLPGLCAAADGLDVTLRTVEDPPGAAAAVPAPVGLSLYRTVQEALTNVRKHSTGRRVSVVVRVERPAPGTPRAAGTGDRFAHGFAEVEVLDDGRPLAAAGGSGLGLLGVRERVATHGGVAEIGPRLTGGYRVRVRLPLPAAGPDLQERP